jgi:RNA polymerase sigma factor (sigma-70 family)
MAKKSSKSFSEAEILQALQSGEGVKRQQFSGILYEKHFEYIYTGVKRYNISFETAHDAYGDAIIKVCRKVQRGEFRGESKLSSYLFRAFSNRCVDKIRRSASNLITDDIEEHYDLPDKALTIMQELELQEQWEEVSKHLDELGERCRHLLIDTEYYGYSLQEVADRRGISNAATAGNLKYRCLKRLRKLLGMSN